MAFVFTNHAISLLEQLEGLLLKATRDKWGVLNIGFGDTHDVTEGMVITKEEAVERLMVQLKPAMAEVDNVVTWEGGGSSPTGRGQIEDMTNNMYSALVIFTYNIGENAFENSTIATILGGVSGMQDLGQNEIPYQMRRWNKVKGQVVQGLVNRREAEIKLWNTPDEPSAIAAATS